MLSAHFLALLRARYRRTHRDLPKELRDAFSAVDWPGNVRELENAMPALS